MALKFQAEDGYSYILNRFTADGRYLTKQYRIDSEEINIQLGTNEFIEIKRLDISPETSIKLKNIRESSN